MRSTTDKFLFCPFCKTPLADGVEEGASIQKCASCGWINWMDPKPTVSIVIEEDGRILMLRRAKEPLGGYWVLPGGFVRHDETPQEAILRETKEEIGLTPILYGVFEANRIDNDPRGIHINIFYEGTIDGDVLLSGEHNEFGLFSQTELPAQTGYHHREAIETWYSKRKPKI